MIFIQTLIHQLYVTTQIHLSLFLYKITSQKEARNLFSLWILSPSPQYDVVPIQPSVVICSCSHPSMVRNHPDSCSPLAIPGASSSHCPGMEGSVSEARTGGASSSGQDSDRHTQPPVEAPQPRKKKPDDFKFGKILGEGSFSTVMHSAIGFSPCRCCNMSLFWWMYLNESFAGR